MTETIIPSFKVCKKCKLEKAAGEFYHQRSSKDGLMYACKDCWNNHYKQRRLKQGYRAKHKSEPHMDSEGEFIRVLKSQGIYAAPGKSSEWNYIDVVAWGCVRIEVKTSRYWPRFKKSGGYLFTFSKRQMEDGLGCDLICLVCIDQDNQASYHLFPANHPVFFYNGKRKRGIRYGPNTKTHANVKGLPLDRTLMDKAKDSWHMVEAERQRVSQELRHGQDLIEILKAA